MKTLLKLLAIASLACAMAFAFAACGDDEDYYDDENDEHYAAEDIEPGTEFGSFASTDLNGNEATSDLFAEKDLTVLNVWGTYCDPCKEEMPELAEWKRELPDNVQIVGIVIDVPEGDADMIKLAKKICKKTGVAYPNILMNDSVDEALTVVEAIPTTFFLDKEGKTVCAPVVGNDVEAYKKNVEEYLDKIN